MANSLVIYPVAASLAVLPRSGPPAPQIENDPPPTTSLARWTGDRQWGVWTQSVTSIQPVAGLPPPAQTARDFASAAAAYQTAGTPPSGSWRGMAVNVWA